VSQLQHESKNSDCLNDEWQ